MLTIVINAANLAQDTSFFIPARYSTEILEWTLSLGKLEKLIRNKFCNAKVKFYNRTANQDFWVTCDDLDLRKKTEKEITDILNNEKAWFVYVERQ
jgi:hypothetical protein